VLRLKMSILEKIDEWSTMTHSCPFDGTEMVRVKSTIETEAGQSWLVRKYLVEEHVCPKCGLRIRAKYEVIGGI
jgi:hypothetical protein